MASLSPPDRRPPLDDGVVALRPFEADDLPTFEAAFLPGGNDGTWLIPVEDDARRTLAEHVRGRSGGGLVGASLAVTPATGGLPLGALYLTARGAGSVEVSYGVAPAHRGRGVATRAVRLAVPWLIGERGWRRVELRISDDHLASRRVAVKAGFRPAGFVRSEVPAVGEVYIDRLYVTTAESHPGRSSDRSPGDDDAPEYPTR